MVFWGSGEGGKVVKSGGVFDQFWVGVACALYEWWGVGVRTNVLFSDIALHFPFARSVSLVNLLRTLGS